MNQRLSRFPELSVLPASFVLMLGAAGCGGDSDTTPARTAAAPAEPSGPTGNTPQQLAKSIAELSRQFRDSDTVPSTFCKNTNANPQRMYSKSPAKLIVNSLCQPPLGRPVGVYNSSNFNSQKVGTVNDGDVVEADCIDTDGQTTTNVLGETSASNTWVKISRDNVSGFVSEVNLAYVDDSKFNQCT